MLKCMLNQLGQNRNNMNNLTEDDKKKISELKNPGGSFLFAHVYTAALNQEIIDIGANFTVKNSNFDELLESHYAKIVYHIDIAVKTTLEEENSKEHVQVHIARLREAGVLLAAGIPDEDPMWDLFHSSVQMRMEEATNLREQMNKRLGSENKNTREDAYKSLAAAGILMIRMIDKTNPDVSVRFLKEIARMALAIKARVICSGIEETAGEAKMAFRFVQMLQAQGVVFNAEGDPLYTEVYEDLVKRKIIPEHKPSNSTDGNTTEQPNSTGERAESQGGPLPGSEHNISEKG